MKPQFPFAWSRVTSLFGPRPPIPGVTSVWTTHWGIDFAVGRGTDIKIVHDGVLDGSGRDHYLYGNWAQYDHGGFKTRYHGLTSASIGRLPRTAALGTVIAQSDQPGASTGPHLHFETLVNGVHVNPNGLTSLRGSYRVPSNNRPAGGSGGKDEDLSKYDEMLRLGKRGVQTDGYLQASLKRIERKQDQALSNQRKITDALNANDEVARQVAAIEEAVRLGKAGVQHDGYFQKAIKDVQRSIEKVQKDLNAAASASADVETD